jgi:hypothetical protein
VVPTLRQRRPVDEPRPQLDTQQPAQPHTNHTHHTHNEHTNDSTPTTHNEHTINTPSLTQHTTHTHSTTHNNQHTVLAILYPSSSLSLGYGTRSMYGWHARMLACTHWSSVCGPMRRQVCSCCCSVHTPAALDRGPRRASSRHGARRRPPTVTDRHRQRQRGIALWMRTMPRTR